MASKIYPKYKLALIDGAANIALDTETVKVSLVDTGTYTYSDSHEFYSSVSGVVGTPVTLTSKAISVSGDYANFDAGDATFSAVTGNSVEALIIWTDTGSASTSRLVCFIDNFSAVTPNGGDITVQWNASGIFNL